MRAWLHRRSAELRLGVRIAVAGLGSFALAESLHLPQGYWAVFTALIVTQGSVGGSLKASRDRMIGTLGGAVFGAIVATAVPHEDRLGLALEFALTLIPLAFLVGLYPRYRIAPVTASILLLASISQMSPIEAALYRVLEITIGCVVGIAVSLLVLPARARRLGLAAAGRALDLLARLAEAHKAALLGEAAPESVDALNDAIRRAMARLDELGQEAHQERATYLGDPGDFEPIGRTLRRVRNDLVIVGRTAAGPLAEPVRVRIGADARTTLDAAAALMRGIGQALAAQNPPPPLEPVVAAIDALGLAIAAMRKDGLLHALSEADAGGVFTLGFALEQWRRDIEDLHARATELAGPLP